MKLLVGTAIVFFGTLTVAALVALGGPVLLDLLPGTTGSAHGHGPLQAIVSTHSAGTQQATLPQAAP